MVIFIKRFYFICNLLIFLIDHFVQFSISYKFNNTHLEYLGTSLAYFLWTYDRNQSYMLVNTNLCEFGLRSGMGPSFAFTKGLKFQSQAFRKV